MRVLVKEIDTFVATRVCRTVEPGDKVVSIYGELLDAETDEKYIVIHTKMFDTLPRVNEIIDVPFANEIIIGGTTITSFQIITGTM